MQESHSKYIFGKCWCSGFAYQVDMCFGPVHVCELCTKRLTFYEVPQEIGIFYPIPPYYLGGCI